MIDEERWKKICSRSEIAAIPETEGEKNCALIHICEKCKEEYFCPSLMIPNETKCSCKYGYCCFVCFNEE